MKQRRGHRRINSAAQSENYLLIPNLRANRLHRLVDVIVHRPVLATATNVVDEISQDLLAMRRVRHFRMKLQRENFLRTVFEGRIPGILGHGD